MRARVLVWICLGLNACLAWMLVRLAQEGERASATAPPALTGTNAARTVKTNVVVRRQFFFWSQLESSDYPTYIANLRRIGCPERTIRDIIVADVNDLFADRIRREVVLPEQKWWLADPLEETFETGLAQIRALEAEKQQMLQELLGSGWALQRPGELVSATRFDGPVLSRLAPEVKGQIEQIEAAIMRESGTALDVGPEARRQLAAILTPEQLEEYLLRYSSTARRMREELRGFAAGPDEFRRIFRLRDAYEQQLALAPGDDPASAQRRAELARLNSEAISQALGAERFALYTAMQNPLFRDAQETVARAGQPADKVLPMFQIAQALQDEIARIQLDQNLTDDERRVAVAAAEQQQKNSIERILSNVPAEISPAPRAAEAPLPPMPELPPLPPELTPRPRGPRSRPVNR